MIDAAAGAFPNGGTIVGRSGAGEYLDSLAVDADGRICCASPGKGAVLIFPPQGGAPDRIETPDFLTTNICFGGPDRGTAYVTLGNTGCVAQIDWPVSGLALAFGS